MKRHFSRLLAVVLIMTTIFSSNVYAASNNLYAQWSWGGQRNIACQQ